MPINAKDVSTGLFLFPLNGNNDGVWNEIQQLVPNLTDRSIRFLRFGFGRTQSYSKWVGIENVGKFILVETNYLCKDYRNLYSHFYSKKLFSPDTLCTRIHFFTEPNLTKEQILFNSEDIQDKYIGFSVLQPVLNHNIGCTVIAPGKVLQCEEDSYCLTTRFNVAIFGAKYFVNGYPFITQSAEAMVCAHCAVWGVTRYLSQRHNSYKELKPFDLVQMVSDTRGRKYPGRGMSFEDYSSILSQFGSHPVVLSSGKEGKLNRATSEDVYTYLESGCPVLVSFRGESMGGHVITLIGHTMLPKDEWETSIMSAGPNEYGFYGSSNFLRHYLVADDNFFPYQRLGRNEEGQNSNYAKDRYGKLLISKDNFYSAVIPMPEKAFMKASDARGIGFDFLMKEIGYQAESDNKQEIIKKYLDRCLYQDDTSSGSEFCSILISRVFLTSSKAFKKQKRENYREAKEEEGDLGCRYPLQILMPHFVWVIEISTLDLYKNNQIWGEVVLDATEHPSNGAILYARLFNRIKTRREDGQDLTHKNVKKTFSLFQSNLNQC